MIVFGHSLQVQFQSDCNFPKGIAALLSLNAGLFMYMFSAFYVKTYKKSHAKKEVLDAPPKAKPEELNHTAKLRNGAAPMSSLVGYMDELNNNYEVISPLYAKLKENGHLTTDNSTTEAKKAL